MVIIDKVLSAVGSWSALPDFGDICPTWRSSAEAESAGQYDKHWRGTVAEMLRLLERCQEAMKQGALSVDQEVLTQLGCFDRRINGAGTVAAAASIFLASRYAADPFHGLIEAAFAHGADTDTIASMTGGLLGSVVGSEWLETLAEQAQDALYLRALAERLAKKEGAGTNGLACVTRITKTDLNSLIEKLELSKPGDTVLLPDGREAQTSAPQHHKPRSKTTLAVSWKLTAADGQSLYIKKISRRTTDTSPRAGTRLDILPDTRLEVQLQPVEIVKTGVKLPVRDIVKARAFYEKALGLKVVKESRIFVNFGGVIALVSMDREQSIEWQPKSFALKSATIYIETRSLEAAYNNVCRFNATILTPISQAHGQRFFRCLDPDGNVIELSERP